MTAARKTVLITGASRGIGRASALEMASPETTIIINYKASREAALEVEAFCRERGAMTRVMACDVADPQAVAAMFRTIEQDFGGVDILVNNAGVSSYAMIQDIAPEAWQAEFAVDVHSVFYCTQQAIGHMIDQKWGRIINIASIWGLVGSACESLYSACKGAVIAYTKACAKELVYSGITVNALAPGVVDTDMMQQLSPTDREALSEDLPLGRMLRPEEIAYWVRVMADDRAGALTGQVISPNGGFVIS